MVKNIDIVSKFGRPATFSEPFINPGVGGTQFMVVMLAYLIGKQDELLNVRLVACGESEVNVNFFPGNVKVKNVDSPEESLINSECVICTFSTFSDYPEAFGKVGNLLIWSHNLWDCLEEKIRKRKSASLIVVSEIQRKIAIASGVKNSVYKVQNPIDLSSYPLPEAKDKESKNIVYLGNLTSAKGALHVAKLWKESAKKLKGYTLHMIGGGDLYAANKNNDRRKYEEAVRSTLRDAEEETNIVFHGTIGYSQIQKTLKNCRYGFINPVGRTECFPTALVELMANGVIPLALPKWGNGELLNDYPYGRVNSINTLRVRLQKIGQGIDASSDPSAMEVREYLEQKIEPPSYVAKKWMAIVYGKEKKSVNSKLKEIYMLAVSEPAAIIKLVGYHPLRLVLNTIKK